MRGRENEKKGAGGKREAVRKLKDLVMRCIWSRGEASQKKSGVGGWWEGVKSGEGGTEDVLKYITGRMVQKTDKNSTLQRKEGISKKKMGNHTQKSKSLHLCGRAE